MRHNWLDSSRPPCCRDCPSFWSAGKVLFFANTNNIEEVDPAIKRSGRFDAALFVLPPGPEAKAKVLWDEHKVKVASEVWSKAENGVKTGAVDDQAAAWLALIRYDQSHP